jgi:RNA polymerase-binding transcription factor DksA
MSTLTMPIPVQTDGPDLATHLPELRMMLEEQRRFRIDQLHIHDGSADEHHVDVLDTSADNARVEVDAAVQAAARLALDDIETALERMTTGRYGQCAQCAAPIPVERLLAIPQAPLCMNCQRRAEHRR